MISRDQLYRYAARLLMVSFFLPLKVQVAILGAVMIGALVCRTKPIQPINKGGLLTGVLLLACIGAAFVTPAEYRKVAWQVCERKVSLLAIPLVFALTDRNFLKRIAGEQAYFSYGAVVATLLGNLRFVYSAYFTRQQPVAHSHVAYRQYMEQVTGIHPTYLGMYLTFAICLLICGEGSRLKPVLKTGLVYLLLVLDLALLAKSPTVALALIVFHFLWVRRRDLRRYRPHFVGALLVVVAAYAAIPFVGQRVRELAQFGSTSGATEVHANSINELKMVLATDMAALHDHWVLGVGPGRLQAMLDWHYLCYSIAHQINTGYYDPHSEYLWWWLSFGIGGLALLVVVLGAHVVQAFRSKDRQYLYLMVLLLATFFTESVLARQHGVVFFALFGTLYFMLDRRAPGDSNAPTTGLV